jgi:hypothetical protein
VGITERLLGNPFFVLPVDTVYHVSSRLATAKSHRLVSIMSGIALNCLEQHLRKLGQVPLAARRPFFIVTSLASVITLFSLHLT